MIKKSFLISHNVVIFYFFFWKIISYVYFFIVLISNDKPKSLFTPCKLGSINKSENWFCISGENFIWYLFQLIDLLKSNFNCPSSFALSWVDKVTTGAQSFVSDILYFISPVAED